MTTLTTIYTYFYFYSSHISHTINISNAVLNYIVKIPQTRRLTMSLKCIRLDYLANKHNIYQHNKYTSPVFHFQTLLSMSLLYLRVFVLPFIVVI